MNVRINKGSDVPAYRQLAEQIAFRIASGELKLGDPLPSVREMSLRNKIHKDTVSKAYRVLAGRSWITMRRGQRVIVKDPGEPLFQRPEELDDLIDAVVRNASEHGYTMQDVRQRILQRLLVEPPDHVLLVEEEAGMRQLLLHELTGALPVTSLACAPAQLSENQGLAVGALIVSLLARVWKVPSVIPRGRRIYRLTPSIIDPHVDRIRGLSHPSLIVIVSISEVFLETARAILAPFGGSRHAIETYGLEPARNMPSADVVFCDSFCHDQLKTPNVVPYRLVSAQSVREITNLVPVGGEFVNCPKLQRF